MAGWHGGAGGVGCGKDGWAGRSARRRPHLIVVDGVVFGPKRLGGLVRKRQYASEEPSTSPAMMFESRSPLTRTTSAADGGHGFTCGVGATWKTEPTGL